MNTTYQELFDYLSNELNVIATETQMQEIERIILKKMKENLESTLEKIAIENSEPTQREIINKFTENCKIIVDNDLEIMELKHKIEILKYQNNVLSSFNIAYNKLIK